LADGLRVTSTPAPLSPAARRAVVGLGITQILAWGSVYYVIGVIGPTLVAALGLSSTLVYGGFSLSLVVGALLAPATGRAIDRIGGRKVMAAGSVVAASGLAVAANAQGAAGYLASCVLLGVAVATTLYDAAFAAITQIAGRQARRAITLLTLFGGFASTLAWPLTTWLASVWGWRETYWFYAAAHLLVCLPVHWLLLADGPDQRAFDAPKESAQAERDGAMRGPARRAAFWLFGLALTANSFVFSGLSAHFIAMLGTLGLAERTAVLVGMAIGPMQVLARVLEMASAARHDALAVGRASAALLPVGVGCLALAALHPAAAFAFAVAYGLANGLITIAKGAMTLHLFGSAGYGATLGLLSLPSLAARAAAPTIFSFTNETAGVGATLALCVAAALGGLAAMEGVARLARRGGG
jgi:MFS family permease